MTPAQSATPLAHQLDLKPGMRCWFHDMPDDLRAAIDPDALSIDEQPSASEGLQCAHLFASDTAKLERELAAVAQLLAANGFVWVSWPADAAPDEGHVKTLAERLRLTLSKQVALTDRWSAAKLVRGREA